MAVKRQLFLTNPFLKGSDITWLQRQLNAKGHMLEVDGRFGPATAEACREEKWNLGFPEEYVIPTCGPKLAGYLAGEKLPADYRKRAAQRKKITPESSYRKKVVEYFMWALANEAQGHYLQARPMDLNNLHHVPFYDDCSEFYTKACKWAGLPDPNGNNFNGYGFTGTLRSHMHHIPVYMVEPGDAVVYGYGSGHHVSGVILGYPALDLCSHGREAAPERVTFARQKEWQPGPVTWLSLFPLRSEGRG